MEVPVDVLGLIWSRVVECIELPQLTFAFGGRRNFRETAVKNAVEETEHLKRRFNLIKAQAISLCLVCRTWRRAMIETSAGESFWRAVNFRLFEREPLLASSLTQVVEQRPLISNKAESIPGFSWRTVCHRRMENALVRQNAVVDQCKLAYEWRNDLSYTPCSISIMECGPEHPSIDKQVVMNDGLKNRILDVMNDLKMFALDALSDIQVDNRALFTVDKRHALWTRLVATECPFLFPTADVLLYEMYLQWSGKARSAISQLCFRDDLHISLRGDLVRRSLDVWKSHGVVVHDQHGRNSNRWDVWDLDKDYGYYGPNLRPKKNPCPAFLFGVGVEEEIQVDVTKDPFNGSLSHLRMWFLSILRLEDFRLNCDSECSDHQDLPERSLHSYERFLRLAAKYPQEPLAPSVAIDWAWHAHMILPSYEEDCKVLIGRVLHHDMGESNGERTRQIWMDEFGVVMDKDQDYRTHRN